MGLHRIGFAVAALAFACGSARTEREGAPQSAQQRHSAPATEPTATGIRLHLVDEPPPLPTPPPSQEGTGGSGAPSLAPLVEAVRPTVVGVTTRTTRQQVSELPPGGMEDFWERFFGGPPPFGVPEEPFGGSPRGGEPMGVGSGVIIDPQGLVVTNNHVLEDADKVLVSTFDCKEYTAEVVGRDADTDLAVLRLKGVKGKLPAAKLGVSDSLRVGDYVLAIGDPFGLEFTVTSGIISAKARTIGAGDYDDFLQTDAAINPGNSGGPLFDLQGNVVGINTAIVAGGSGIGFAVPIDLVKALLPQLVEKGKVVRGFLGVGIQDLTPELARALGIRADQGAVVASVQEGGPGAKAGLKTGDVVVSLNGQPVEGASKLSRSVAMLQPGQKATLEVLRDGKKQQLTAQLGTKPQSAQARRAEQQRPPTQEPETGELGLSLQPVPPDVAKRLDVQGGALVTQVTPGSPASHAGLMRGDVIVEANRKPVSGPKDVAAAVRSSREKELLLRVRRGDGAVFLVIPPREKGEPGVGGGGPPEP